MSQNVPLKFTPNIIRFGSMCFIYHLNFNKFQIVPLLKIFFSSRFLHITNQDGFGVDKCYLDHQSTCI